MTLTQTRADEAIALQLMQAIRREGENSVAPSQLELVSVTLDVTGNAVEDTNALTFEAKIDRKTRTILFTGGHAVSGADVVMSATAVYRIVSA